jgi:Protein of unknown function, DUF547
MAMRRAIFSLLLFASVANADNSSYTRLLQTYVHDGRVNYPGLCKASEFATYIDELSKIDPAKFTNQKDELAFWINAYNAFTLKVICDHYPVKSINDLHTGGLIIGTIIHGTIWDKKFVPIHDEQISLNHIEHEIIRKKFREPRAHFALVCASKSCPALRSEAYEGATLDQQLNDQAKIFFSDPRKNRFEVDRRIAHLSKILDWYSRDFGSSKDRVLLFVASFLPDETAAAVKADPDAWKVDYTDYDWSLNE